jgi:hypothetical protein
MADTKDLVTKRKEAYDFIKNTLRQPPWRLPLDASDEILADLIFGEPKPRYVSALSSLREGKENPTEELVKHFKDLCQNIIAESEINQYLVNPFKNP